VESVLGVESVGIARREQPTTQADELGVAEHGADEPAAQAVPSLLLDDEHVREIRKRRPIGNDPSEADLSFRKEETEGQ